ncbi:MAG: TonB-dependent receptor plug domain-containing protein, partial [Bacteroidetes bacterium]|nr:TonB-dependent receptor plug domain-containing protein [Bacteroidota bacterium]
MKFTALLLLAACLQVSARTSAQNITLKEKDAPLESIFGKIEQQSGYSFFYDKPLIRTARPVTVNIDNLPLDQALAICLKNQPFSFKIFNKTVAIKAAENTSDASAAAITSPPVDVKGRVLNEKGEPAAGITVTVKGTRRATTTDANGFFSLNNVPDAAILVFSAVQIESTVEIKASYLAVSSNYIVRVKTKVSQLDDVQVIGYGTTTRRKSTGSVASLSSEDIAKQPVANPLNALQGRVAGAVITQANGLPGSNVTVQIRGIASLGNGTVPLYIIDGVPFNIIDGAVPVAGTLNAFGISNAGGGISPFNLINPSDIERIDILKDADATSIYGTRGANGVVLITTKKAKAGKTKLDINVYHGIGKVAHFIDMLNLEQYRALRRKAFANDNITPTAANAPDLFVYDSTRYTDWQRKYLGGTARTTDAQATLSGGDTRTRFSLGAGYHKETTVFPGDFGDQRGSVRLNVDHNSLDRKLNASASVLYSYDQTDLLATDLASTYTMTPTYKLYNADGSLFWDGNYTNPESRIYQKYLGKTNNLISNVQLRYTILPGLDIKSSLGFNKLNVYQNLQTPAISQNPNTSPTNNARFAFIDQQSYNFEPQITYARKIG